MNGVAFWAFAKLAERAQLLGASEPEHYLLPFSLSCLKKGHPRKALGYDVTDHQRSWRSAWRSLIRATKKKAMQLAEEQATSAGKNPESAKKAAADRFDGFRFHDLRHHFITKLAESGQPDAVILGLAGHLSKRMMAHYTHIRDAIKQKAVAAVESYCPGLPQGENLPDASIPTKIM